jgi:large subunit ribosomal protein L21
MFAIIRTGGKQYKVSANDIVRVEKLDQDTGTHFTFSEVLMVGEGAKITVGTPTVAGAQVVAEILEQTRADKVIIFKKKRRHQYRRKKGHRQHLTVLRITDILTDGKAAPKKDAKPKAENAEVAPKVAAPKASASKAVAAPKAKKSEAEPKKAPAKKAKSAEEKKA